MRSSAPATRAVDARTPLQAHFLEAMSHMAETVNIVTTDGLAGRQGLTVSAMASVSADLPKPVLLVCVHRAAGTAQAIIGNGAFCLNILRDSHAAIADCFAGRWRTADGDKFSCTDWVIGGTGAVRLTEALAAFDCRLLNATEIGTHLVLYGSVEHVSISPEGSPLLYARRRYSGVSALGGLAGSSRSEAA